MITQETIDLCEKHFPILQWDLDKQGFAQGYLLGYTHFPFCIQIYWINDSWLAQVRINSVYQRQEFVYEYGSDDLEHTLTTVNTALSDLVSVLHKVLGQL